MAAWLAILRVFLSGTPTSGRPYFFARSSVSHQAHLRSHSGPGASAVLCGAPTGPEFTLQPGVVLERLRLPLQTTESRCECGACLDQLGRHRGACPESGRLRSRAVAPESTLARICFEAGAVVRTNVMLRDMNITVSALDERKAEVLASSVPLKHGAQLAVDVTLRSALKACVAPATNAARVGARFTQARRDKELKYHTLVECARCLLVVVRD